MGLLDAIPGLVAHQVEPTVASFDRHKAEVLMRDAYSLVSSMYPTGAFEWLDAYRSDVKSYLTECEREVDESVLVGDQQRFERALAKWSEAHRKAFLVYTGRIPAIERGAGAA